jgi:hypothetical protein
MGEIEIEIRPDGQVIISTHGIKGKECLKYAEFIQQLVGREESRRLTDEFHEPENSVRIQQQNQQRR